MFATWEARFSCSLGDPRVLAHLGPFLKLQPQWPLCVVAAYSLMFGLSMGGAPPRIVVISSPPPSAFLHDVEGLLRWQRAGHRQPHRAWCLSYGSADSAAKQGRVQRFKVCKPDKATVSW